MCWNRNNNCTCGNNGYSVSNNWNNNGVNRCNVFRNGYNSGFESGRISGYNSGYQAGYQAGYQVGYEAGFEAGKNSVTIACETVCRRVNNCG